MMTTNRLEVLLHNGRIGEIALLEGERTIFAFSDDYRENEARATLGLGFKTKAGELITQHLPRRVRLMPFFSNLLPEGPLRKYLASLARVKPTREFHLLSALGQDLPGALTVRPIEGSSSSGSELEKNSPLEDPVTRKSYGVPLDTVLRSILARLPRRAFSWSVIASFWPRKYVLLSTAYRKGSFFLKLEVVLVAKGRQKLQ